MRCHLAIRIGDAFSAPAVPRKNYARYSLACQRKFKVNKQSEDDGISATNFVKDAGHFRVRERNAEEREKLTHICAPTPHMKKAGIHVKLNNEPLFKSVQSRRATIGCQTNHKEDFVQTNVDCVLPAAKSMSAGPDDARMNAGGGNHCRNCGWGSHMLRKHRKRGQVRGTRALCAIDLSKK